MVYHCTCTIGRPSAICWKQRIACTSSGHIDVALQENRHLRVLVGSSDVHCRLLPDVLRRQQRASVEQRLACIKVTYASKDMERCFAIKSLDVQEACLQEHVEQQAMLGLVAILNLLRNSICMLHEDSC